MDEVDQRPATKRIGALRRGLVKDLRWSDIRSLVTTLQWRRDLALPAVLAVVQVGATLGAEHHHHQLHAGVGNWVLLLVGPLALVVRRRYPVGLES
jgi:hypothetical protein